MSVKAEDKHCTGYGGTYGADTLGEVCHLVEVVDNPESFQLAELAV